MAMTTIPVIALDISKDGTVKVVFKYYFTISFFLFYHLFHFMDKVFFILLTSGIGLNSAFLICRYKLLLLQSMLKQWHLPEQFGRLSVSLSRKIQWTKL